MSKPHYTKVYVKTRIVESFQAAYRAERKALREWMDAPSAARPQYREAYEEARAALDEEALRLGADAATHVRGLTLQEGEVPA